MSATDALDINKESQETLDDVRGWPAAYRLLRRAAALSRAA